MSSPGYGVAPRSEPAGTTWGGNHAFGARERLFPSTIEQLRSIVGSAGNAELRAVGSSHSFNPVADTTGIQVSTTALPVVCELDSDRSLARVSGGLNYGKVGRWLNERGCALANLGSLPHISVAGACSTGTHGSGNGNGILATSVRGLTVLTASGELVQLSADGSGMGCGPEFAGAVVALGSLGIVVDVTLAVQPTFEVAQVVYDGVPFDAFYESIDDVFAGAYSVSVFHRWGRPLTDTVWCKYRSGLDPAPPETLLGGRRAGGPRHPVLGEDPVAATAQLDQPGAWLDRLPHFRLDHTPSSGQEIQSEYLIGREQARAALSELQALGPAFQDLLLVAELRTMAADDLWLSPAYQRETLGLHFTWKLDTDAVAQVLPIIEERLLPLGARPHWGKVFAAAPEVVGQRYPRLDDSARLARTFDPQGVFVNDFTRPYLR